MLRTKTFSHQEVVAKMRMGTGAIRRQEKADLTGDTILSLATGAEATASSCCSSCCHDNVQPEGLILPWRSCRDARRSPKT